MLGTPHQTLFFISSSLWSLSLGFPHNRCLFWSVQRFCIPSKYYYNNQIKADENGSAYDMYG